MKIRPRLQLQTYYLIFLQTLKLNLIPYMGVQNWLIDNFKYPFYTHYLNNGAWLSAPYSFIWQLWYLPTSIIGWLPFMWLMWSFDTVLLTVVYKFQSPIYTLAYAISSWIFFIINPADLLVFWLAVIGKEKWPISILAAIVKLPTLAPAYVWNFILFHSIGDQIGVIWPDYVGIPRYFFLGGWIIHPYIPRVYRLIKKSIVWFLDAFMDTIDPSGRI